MPSAVIFVGLDIDSPLKGKAFVALRAVDKLILIANRIHKICLKLQKQAPNAMWIVGWREYGIQNSSEENFIWSDFAELLKQKLLTLTQQFPNLTIIAGSLAIRETFRNGTYLAQVARQYKQHKWVEFLEENEKHSSHLKIPSRFRMHKKEILELKRFPQPVDVITNTCLIFNGKHCQRYDKIAPYNENFEPSQDLTTPYFTAKNTKPVMRRPSLNPAVFLPARKKYSNPLVMVKHPDGKTISLGIEICRDHFLAVLKTLHPRMKPMIHVVVSASAEMQRSHLHGAYVAHMDRKQGVSFARTRFTYFDACQMLAYSSQLVTKEKLLTRKHMKLVTQDAGFFRTNHHKSGLSPGNTIALLDEKPEEMVLVIKRAAEPPAAKPISLATWIKLTFFEIAKNIYPSTEVESKKTSNTVTPIF